MSPDRADKVFVERRSEPRFAADCAVWVTLLGNGADRIPGRALDWSGKGFRVSVPKPIQIGSALKVEIEDSLVLAEVCFCALEKDGYVVGLQVDQVLRNLNALTKLNAHLLNHSSAPVEADRYLCEDEKAAC